MTFVAKLIETAAADTDVLRELDQNGDEFSKFRQVDFLVVAPSPDKALAIRDFINDFSYGKASVSDLNDSCSVHVAIDMPVQQSIILCVSGFMACVAQLFGAELDGWECPVRKRT